MNWISQVLDTRNDPAKFARLLRWLTVLMFVGTATLIVVGGPTLLSKLTSF